MSTVTIRRLTGRARPGPGRTPPVEELLREIADHRLEEVLDGIDLPAGEWCVRRVDLQLPWDETRPASATATSWAEEIAEGLVDALTTGSPEVLHFETHEQALADLILGVVQRDTRHAWAWRQLGLITDSDPDPRSDHAGLLVAALARAPRSALGAVVTAAGGAGGPALHRALGRRGWLLLAEHALLGAGVPVALARPETPADPGLDQASAPDGPVSGSGTTPPVPVRRTGPSARATATVATSRLARALLSSGVRPEAGTARCWAILALAEADPAALRHPGPTLVTEVAHLLSAHPSRPRPAHTSRPPATLDDRHPATGTSPEKPEPGGGPGPHGPVDSTEEVARGALPHPGTQPGAQPGSQRAPAPESAPAAVPDPGDAGDPALAPEVEGAATDWAGLLYLIGCAEAADVPELLFADPALQRRPSRWVLHQLGQLFVPAPRDDPAVLALAGLLDPRGLPDGSPPTPAERAALKRWSRRWAAQAAVAVDRLDEDPADVVLDLAARPGLVTGSPGWLEVRLGLEGVDVAVRRAGLDLDPGWVPWLGTVVRLVYV